VTDSVMMQPISKLRMGSPALVAKRGQYHRLITEACFVWNQFYFLPRPKVKTGHAPRPVMVAGSDGALAHGSSVLSLRRGLDP
jgi:hypothetical protein